MKLADITLTEAQAAQLIAFLQERVDAAERAEAKHRAAEENQRLAEKHYAKIAELARDTARQSGPVVGVRDYDLAVAAWQAFIESEGWYSPYDVAEYWDREDEEFADGWRYAYMNELDAIRRERKEGSAR